MIARGGLSLKLMMEIGGKQELGMRFSENGMKSWKSLTRRRMGTTR